MKKFLSLVLALVMTMSLVTVSAGAKDFTDNSKINYKEAVDVMSAAKVIDGYAEGDFRPANTLTRGAAAKIICNLILGPTTAEALVADAAPYSDVPTTNTFAGYIAYCAKEGIISGYADGTFRPAATLSGYAFMKMLLGALGYDATAEGYTVNNWSINVAKRALNVGLDDDLNGDFNGIKAVNREEACLYAFNTLKAPMVEYANSSSVTVNGITFTNKSDAKEIKQGKTVIIPDEYQNFCEKYFTKLDKKITTDDFGRPAHEWKYDKKSVGTYADTAKLVYTTGVKGTDLADDLDDADLKVGKTIEVVRNGNLNDDGTAKTVTIGDTLKSKNEIGGNGVVLEIYSNSTDSKGNDVADRVVAIVTYLAKVEKVTKDKASTKKTDESALTLSYKDTKGNTVTLTVGAEDDVDNFDAVYSKVKKDDYVLIVPKNDNSKSKEVLSIAVPESVTGKLTKVNSDKDTITIGGTTYDVALTSSTDYTVDKAEQTVYLDSYGYVIGGEKSSTSSDVIYLVKVYDDTDKYGDHTYYAQIVTADGEVQEIETNQDQYNKFVTVKTDANNKKYTELSKGVYTYETNDDDEAIFTEAVAAGDAVAVSADKDLKANDAKVAGKYYADEVTFVYVNKSGAKLKVTTANGVQKVSKEDIQDAYAVLNDDDEVETVFIGKKAAAVVDQADLLFIADTSAAGSAMDNDNKKGTTYELWIKGEKQVEIVDPKDIEGVGYYSYAINSTTGRYELTLEDDDYVSVKLTATTDKDGNRKIDQIAKNKFVTLNDNLQDRVLADDCAIYDTTDNDIETLSDIVAQVEDEGNNNLALGVIYDSDAKEITCIYVYEK